MRSAFSGTPSNAGWKKFISDRENGLLSNFFPDYSLCANLVHKTPFQNVLGQSAFSSNTFGPGGRSYRNDLHVAADSLTNAMSTLVRELNSGTSL